VKQNSMEQEERVAGESALGHCFPLVRVESFCWLALTCGGGCWKPRGAHQKCTLLSILSHTMLYLYLFTNLDEHAYLGYELFLAAVQKIPIRRELGWV